MTVNVFFRALKVAGRIKDFCSCSDVLLVFLCPFSSFLSPQSLADLGINQIWSCSGEPDALEQVPAADVCSE